MNQVDLGAADAGRRPAGGAVEAEMLSRTQFLQRAAALGASMSMASLLAACGGSSQTASTKLSNVGTTNGKPPETPTGTFNWALISAPASIDQALVGDTGSTNLACAVSEQLTRPNADNSDVVGLLLTEFELSDDGREWIGKVRPNVKFHDGVDFDATAIRATLEYAVESAGLGTVLLPKFREIDDSDPAVIRLIMKDPAPDLSRNLTFVFMQSPKQIALGKGALGKRQVGTGPYKFVSMTSTKIELEAFTDYWGEGPYFERVTMSVTPDLGAQLNALQSGSVDLATEVPATQAIQLLNNPKVQVVSNAHSQRVAYLVVKTAVAPTDDVKIRQAISYAIDRRTLAKSVLHGYAKPADSFEPPSNYGYKPMDPAYPFDPERAKQLISASKYAGNVPPITLAYIPGATDALSQATAEQLRQAGFTVNLDTLEEGVFNAETGEVDAKHNLYMTQHGWVGGGPLIYAISLMQDLGNLDKGAPKEVNDELAAYTKDINVLPDGPERLAAIDGAQHILAEQLPYIPVVFQNMTDIISKRVQGYTCGGNLLTDLRPVYFSE